MQLSKHRAINGVYVKHQFLPLYSRIWTKNGFPEEQSRGFLVYSLQDLQLPQTKLMFSSQQNIFQQERLFNEYISTVMHIGGNCLWIYILRCCYDFSEMFTKKWQYDSFKTGSSYEYPRKLLLKIHFDVPLWLQRNFHRKVTRWWLQKTPVHMRVQGCIFLRLLVYWYL